MVFGYARVSTKGQSIDRQIANIQSVDPEAVIIQEKFTATTINRPEWSKLHKGVKAGDKIIFDSVSRMSRNAAEGVSTYFDLYNRGVELEFIKEPHINSAVYRHSVSQTIDHTDNEIANIYIDATNKVIQLLAAQQIKLAFERAEQDNNDRRQAIKEGMAVAKLNGSEIGLKAGTKLTTKKSIAAKEVILKHSKDFGGTLSDAEVIKLAGISRNSFYKYKAELRTEA